jgi:hypothetical protein
VAPRPYLSRYVYVCVCVRANKINIERAHAANKRTAAAALRVYGAPAALQSRQPEIHARGSCREDRKGAGGKAPFLCVVALPSFHTRPFSERCFFAPVASCRGTLADSNCLTIADWRTSRPTNIAAFCHQHIVSHA